MLFGNTVAWLLSSCNVRRYQASINMHVTTGSGQIRQFIIVSRCYLNGSCDVPEDFPQWFEQTCLGNVPTCSDNLDLQHRSVKLCCAALKVPGYGIQLTLVWMGFFGYVTISLGLHDVTPDDCTPITGDLLSVWAQSTTATVIGFILPSHMTWKFRTFTYLHRICCFRLCGHAMSCLRFMVW